MWEMLLKYCIVRLLSWVFLFCISLINCKIPTTDIMPNYPDPANKYLLNVTILITLTTGGALPTDLGRTGAAIEMAIKHARINIVPQVNLHYLVLTRPGMTDCVGEENHAAYLITQYAYEEAGEKEIPPVGLLVGPACSVATQHVGRIAADMNLPLVNSQATSDYFDDRSIFKTMTRMAYTMFTLDIFSLSVLDALNYTNVGIIYDEVMPWSQVTGQVFERILYYRRNIRMYTRELPYKPADNIDKTLVLKKASEEARVIFIMAAGHALRDWMVFITYEWFRSPYFGEYTWKYNDELDEKARDAYRVLLKISSHEYWTNPTFSEWSNEVKSQAKRRFGYEYRPNETVTPAVTGMFDGIVLYAYALNETIATGENPFNGTVITQRMWNRTIPSAEGLVKIRENGVKDQSFILTQSNFSTGDWNIVMSYDGISGIFHPDVRPIFWINGKSLPKNEPTCGFRNEKLSCLLGDSNDSTVITVVVVVLVFLGINGIAGFSYYRKHKLEQQLHDDWWRIQHNNVRLKLKSETSHTSMKSIVSQKSMHSGNSDVGMVACGAIFTTLSGFQHEHLSESVGRYNGKLVFIRPLKQKVPITREFLLHLTKLRTVVHDNLNPLVGICAEPGYEAAYTEYCVKRSLSDLIHNDAINLDWSFKISLITDLIMGMEFLQNSFFRSHGYLHSSNCVIDSRFALKITDFHLPQLRSLPTSIADAASKTSSEIDYRSLLWRAPEHLRKSMPINGTRKGDSYSSGIIFQEVAVRTEPFYDQSTTLSYSTIITRVAGGEDPPFRPVIPTDGIPKEILQIISMCLQEQPDDRPSFSAIKVILRKSKLMEDGNIMDSLLKRMENYARDLEELVAERTGAFSEEKKKAEELLYQLMPKVIADVLKVGGSVPVEAFECVTVYFSDIVGFVALSAESSPFEIVEFLNDVYTLLDRVIESFDAYKVETISDTYMVASGLPIRNENRHASEIARMALTFLEEALRFKIKHRPHLVLNLRIGINSGPCATGIVGLKMPRYCLFGDTVNTASRMESTGQALRIHISSTTKNILDSFKIFKMELRGEIEVKGKGKHITYWLLGMNEIEPTIDCQ